MGNENGKPQPYLGVSAVATVSTVEEADLVHFDKRWTKLSHGEIITRADMTATVEERENIVEADRELLDKIYTLFDTNGKDTVNYKDLLAGLSTIITGAPNYKLFFAISLFDTRRAKVLNRSEYLRLLKAINKTVSFLVQLPLKALQYW